MERTYVVTGAASNIGAGVTAIDMMGAIGSGALLSQNGKFTPRAIEEFFFDVRSFDYITRGAGRSRTPHPTHLQGEQATLLRQSLQWPRATCVHAVH
jgi:hypothetical protein